MKNFAGGPQFRLFCRHLGGGYGSAGMRPERRPSGRNAWAALSRLRGILAKSDKSREREGSALASAKARIPFSYFIQ
jgi:hypothetical protein